MRFLSVPSREREDCSDCVPPGSQSNQATASACAVNNINLIKGAIGREGASVFQFNGQPTAQVRVGASTRPISMHADSPRPAEQPRVRL